MLRLGKLEHQFDERTLMLANFIADDVVIPASFDFDLHRSRFPLEMWGNDEWGDCVIVGQANQLMRHERIEQRRTLPLKTEDVVARYKALTGSQTAGDLNDRGLVVLDALKAWRGGWDLDFSKSDPPRTYRIAAYGELDPHNFWQLQAAMYFLHGVQFGFWLPETAQDTLNDENPVWDYIQTGDHRERPGSWGGHLVYGKAYFSDGSFEVLTWGMKVKVTQAFISRYCDEAWAVVDDFDQWRHQRILDVEALKNRLREIGASVS
jgi:hypothetical protein